MALSPPPRSTSGKTTWSPLRRRGSLSRTWTATRPAVSNIGRLSAQSRCPQLPVRIHDCSNQGPSGALLAAIKPDGCPDLQGLICRDRNPAITQPRARPSSSRTTGGTKASRIDPATPATLPVSQRREFRMSRGSRAERGLLGTNPVVERVEFVRLGIAVGEAVLQMPYRLGEDNVEVLRTRETAGDTLDFAVVRNVFLVCNHQFGQQLRNAAAANVHPLTHYLLLLRSEAVARVATWCALLRTSCVLRHHLGLCLQQTRLGRTSVRSEAH